MPLAPVPRGWAFTGPCWQSGNGGLWPLNGHNPPLTSRQPGLPRRIRQGHRHPGVLNASFTTLKVFGGTHVTPEAVAARSTAPIALVFGRTVHKGLPRERKL